MNGRLSVLQVLAYASEAHPVNKWVQLVSYVLVACAGYFFVMPLPFLGDQVDIAWFYQLDRNVSVTAVAPGFAIVFGMTCLAVYLYRGREIIRPLICVGGLLLLGYTQLSQPSDILFLLVWETLLIAILLGESARRYIIVLWMGLLVMHVGFALWTYATGYWQMKTPSFGYRASGFYLTPNVLYPVTIIAVFSFLSAASTVSSRWKSMLAYVLAGLALLTLVMTFTRAAWLGVAVGLFISAPSHGATMRRVCFIIGVLLLFGIVVVRTHGGMIGSGEDRSSRNRPRIWLHAARVWWQRPWTGHGFSAFSREEVVGKTPAGLPYLPGEPKSLLLNVAVEWGLVGVILHVGLFGAALRAACRQRNYGASATDRMLGAVLVPTLSAFLAAGLVDTPVLGPFMRVPGTMTVAVLAGMILGAQAGEGRPRETMRCKASLSQ